MLARGYDRPALIQPERETKCPIRCFGSLQDGDNHLVADQRTDGNVITVGQHHPNGVLPLLQPGYSGGRAQRVDVRRIGRYRAGRWAQGPRRIDDQVESACRRRRASSSEPICTVTAVVSVKPVARGASPGAVASIDGPVTSTSTTSDVLPSRISELSPRTRVSRYFPTLWPELSRDLARRSGVGIGIVRCASARARAQEKWAQPCDAVFTIGPPG